MIIWGLRLLPRTASLARLSHSTHDEDHLTHIFAVSIFSEALVNLLILLVRGQIRLINKVPEANCTV